jgi:hypothetical protein
VNLDLAVDLAVVLDETQLAGLVHKKANPGASGAYDLCQCFLAYLGDRPVGLTFLFEVGQQEKHARQPFFTGVKELVNQVVLKPNIAGEQK